MTTSSSPRILVAHWVAVVLVVALAGCSANFERQDPEGHDGCVIDNHFMVVGETFNTGPEPCNTYTCQARGHVTGLTCPWFSAGEGCKIVPGNQSAVYPYCCPVESCNDSPNELNADIKS